MMPEYYTKKYRQLRNTESKRNNSDNKHTSNITYGLMYYTFKNIYVCTQTNRNIRTINDKGNHYFKEKR